MALINGIIGQRRFEVVRDIIGTILTTELANQALLNTQEAQLLKAKVWQSRFIPFDQGELPAISVNYAGGPLQDQHQGQSNHVATYHVDVFTKGPATTTTDGDRNAQQKRDRLLGVCEAILDNPQYKVLGQTPPFLFYRRVTSIDIAGAPLLESTFSVMGRLTLEVKFPETYELISPAEWGSIYTTVKLEETTKGYYYVST